MFNVRDISYSSAPLEAKGSAYEPFFVRKSRMYSKSSSTCSHSFSSETKFVTPTKENLASISPTISQTISSTGIGSLLLDDYPESDSPYEPNSDDDRLYIDLDPPANYQRRVSVNCFTTPLRKVIAKDVPVVPARSPKPTNSQDKPAGTPKGNAKGKPKEISNDKLTNKFCEKPMGKPVRKSAEMSKTKSVEKASEISGGKSEDNTRSAHSELDVKGNETKSHDKKRRKRRTFVNQSSQTELEYIIPANSSSGSVVAPINLEQGKEVVHPADCRIGPVQGRSAVSPIQGRGSVSQVQDRKMRVRRRGRGGFRDRAEWANREKRRFEPERAPTPDLAKRPRGPDQEEDDSDMDPPIRTVT